MSPSLSHGDLVELTFNPPIKEGRYYISRAKGDVLKAAGQTFVADTLNKVQFGRSRVIRIDDHPGVSVVSWESADDKAARIGAQRRGKIVFKSPGEAAEEIREQLDTLAELISAAPKQRKVHGRRDELMLQFNDIADHVELAYTKRAYVLAKARRGKDFHPWLTRDPSVMRIQTVRPLPADFEPNLIARRARGRRLEEAVKIFGEAEREVRRLSSDLRASGYHVRRPHPQAQEILIRIKMGQAKVPMQADLRIFASANGKWEAEAAQPQNKKQARARARMLRDGHLRRLQQVLEALMP